MGNQLSLGDQLTMGWRASRILMAIKPRDYQNEIGEVKNLIIVAKNPMTGEWRIYKAPLEYLEKIMKLVDENDKQFFNAISGLFAKMQDKQFQDNASLIVRMGMGLLDVVEEPYAGQFGKELKELLIVTPSKVYPVPESHLTRFLEILDQNDKGLFSIFDRIVGAKK